jgi:hypothetical protein
MPTGYTCDIKEGITFKQFAYGCSRAFGALMEMRDDPADTPIPKELKLSTYHKDELAKHKKTLAKTIKMTLKQAEKELKAYLVKSEKDCIEQMKKTEELATKYRLMIKEVEKYNPPSTEHQGFKDFMLQQLNDSLRWDCSSDYYAKQLEELKKPMTAEQWRAERIKDAKHDVEYHKKQFAEELDRHNKRNTWVKLLHKSLKNYK